MVETFRKWSASKRKTKLLQVQFDNSKGSSWIPSKRRDGI